MCLCIFFRWPIDYYEKAFVSNLICISHSVQYQSNKRANESKSESNSENEKMRKCEEAEKKNEYQNENTTHSNEWEKSLQSSHIR